MKLKILYASQEDTSNNNDEIDITKYNAYESLIETYDGRSFTSEDGNKLNKGFKRVSDENGNKFIQLRPERKEHGFLLAKYSLFKWCKLKWMIGEKIQLIKKPLIKSIFKFVFNCVFLIPIFLIPWILGVIGEEKTILNIIYCVLGYVGVFSIIYQLFMQKCKNSE